MSEAIKKIVDDVLDKNFTSATDTFNTLIASKLDRNLDQARIKAAARIFSPEVAVQPDEELEVGTVTNDDIADAQLADEVESEIDNISDDDIADMAFDDEEFEADED
jgi:hypothetical protein|tara:strand:- start:1110 stop:1430 length:321 start_codon:yes stop_codon:yes gene_type:complete